MDISKMYINIKKLRTSLGLTQDELAKKTGYKDRTSIAKIESGSVDLPQSKIVLFAQALQTTPASLMGLSIEPENTVDFPSTQIPLIGTIAAGVPILAEENIECYFDVNEFVNADFALRVQGDSMIGAGIYDGDIVFIKKQPTVENGTIAAVMIIDENTSDSVATLKRVYKTPHSLQLVAENKDYPPIIIDKENSDNVVILGKATYFMSSVK